MLAAHWIDIAVFGTYGIGYTWCARAIIGDTIRSGESDPVFNILGAILAVFWPLYAVGRLATIGIRKP